MNATDWFCGVGGMTRGMQAAGFDVVGVDVIRRPEYPATLHLQDVLDMTGDEVPRSSWDHFSPPCQRFSLARAGRVADPPTDADLDLLRASIRLRDRRGARFWSFENVRGALPHFFPYLGRPQLRHGPFFIWTNAPPFLVERSGLIKGLHGSKSRGGQHHRHRDPWLRAAMPIELVRPMARSIAAELAEATA